MFKRKSLALLLLFLTMFVFAVAINFSTFACAEVTKEGFLSISIEREVDENENKEKQCRCVKEDSQETSEYLFEKEHYDDIIDGLMKCLIGTTIIIVLLSVGISAFFIWLIIILKN